MGFVFKARDENLDIDVVIKVPHPHLMRDAEFARRFQREIRSLVKLSHPNIVKIQEVGEHLGTPYAVMAYMAGGDLDNRRPRDTRGRPGKVAAKTLAVWLPAIAGALDFVHRQGYVHRDIKPANILFDLDGNAYVSDFGIAKAIVEGQVTNDVMQITGTGMVLGTPDYMAPEIVLGHAYDGRADQYSLAMTVYELLSGKLPFTGPTPAAILVKQVTEDVPLLGSVSPVSVKLSQVVARGLAKDPAARYASCTQFSQEVISATCLIPVRVSARIAAIDDPSKEVRGGFFDCPQCECALRIQKNDPGYVFQCTQCRSQLRLASDRKRLELLRNTPPKLQCVQDTVPVLHSLLQNKCEHILTIDWRSMLRRYGTLALALIVSLTIGLMAMRMFRDRSGPMSLPLTGESSPPTPFDLNRNFAEPSDQPKALEDTPAVTNDAKRVFSQRQNEREAKDIFDKVDIRP